MRDVSDLRSTIIPRSDQLNAEQLLTGDMTLTVTDVRIGSDDQPVVIHYEGEDGRPFRPCKTVRKVLIFAWGEDGRNWIGKSMTVYNDPAVRFGGMDVGGIRISHLSDIEGEIKVSLTATKGKKALHTIKPLTVTTLADVLAAIKSATGRESMQQAKALASKLTNQPDIDKARAAYGEKAAALKAKAAPATSVPTFAERIAACSDMKELQQIGEEIEAATTGDEQKDLLALLLKRDGELAAPE
jgi:hypothetical protein